MLCVYGRTDRQVDGWGYGKIDKQTDRQRETEFFACFTQGVDLPDPIYH